MIQHRAEFIDRFRGLAWTGIAAAMALASFCGQARGQASQIDQVLTQLDEVHTFSGITISPDGKWVSWTQPAPEGDGNTELLIADWKNSQKTRRITGGDGKSYFREHDAAWSPDSTQIAFFSDAGSSQEQVFVAPAVGGKARRLTNVSGYVTDLHWLPDGKRIGFLYAEHGGGGGPLEPTPEQVGVIQGEIHNQRLAIVDVKGGGDIRQISPAELNIYEYDWAPGGETYAAIAAPGPADNNWWIAQLYVGDVATARMNVVYRPPAQRQLAIPRWSPDGKQIGFIGGLMSDAGFNGGEIFVVSSEGGDARNVTADAKMTPTWFAWHGNDRMLVTEYVDGGSAVATVNVQNGESEVLWKGGEALHSGGNYPNFSVASDGRTSAVIRSSWERPPEVWAGAIGDWQQFTHENAGQKPHWGKAESVIWDSGGFRVQGWLLYPEKFDPSKRYPMVTEIHGGPAGMRGASWPTSHFDMSVMAGLGYFVFFPNPRGSYGGGEAFTRANAKDFGGGDLQDVLAGIDAVLKRVPVDENRLGVTGWSYGGYMTMWTVTQTNRFHAAVAGAGIADWLSYYGENSIDKWMIPYFGASVYDDPAVYAKSSPITYIKQVKTPTLVVVGERDAECPSPQSFEFWHALKTLGVPAELVVYPGEGHAFYKPADRVDVLRRTLAWLDKYLGTTAN